MSVIFIVLVGSFLSFQWLPSAALAGESLDPTLMIYDSKQQSKSWSRSELLKHPAITNLTLLPGEDPAYPNRTMKYDAIPLSQLFKAMTLKGDHVLQFQATDGYSAPFSPKVSDRALNPSNAGPRAYIAIEPLEKKWPELGAKHQGTAGPFYLIWTSPGKMKVEQGQWPFKLSSLKMILSVEKSYPLTLPSLKVSRKSIVFAGYQVFLNKCFSCHTINLQGASHIGPDLNWPESPIEYFGKARLEKHIRDPQSIRYWQKGQMSGFDVESISKVQLQSLLDYFSHMASERRKNPQKIKSKHKAN